MTQQAPTNPLDGLPLAKDEESCFACSCGGVLNVESNAKLLSAYEVELDLKPTKCDICGADIYDLPQIGQDLERGTLFMLCAAQLPLADARRFYKWLREDRSRMEAVEALERMLGPDKGFEYFCAQARAFFEP